MSFWSNIFKKLGFLNDKKVEDKTVATVAKTLKIGDLVYLKFKSPEQIGIISGQNLTWTRLNIEEINRQEIEGSISFIQRPTELLKVHIIEVATFNSATMPGILRRMTFLENEIEILEKLNK